MTQNEFRNHPMSSVRRIAGAAMLIAALTMLPTTGPFAVEADQDEIQLRTVIRSDDGLHVDVVLTNDGDSAVTVLTRDTVLDPRRLAAPLAIERLHRTGVAEDVHVHAVQWQGRLAKRSPPGPDELLSLAPGESASARVALDDGWHVETVGEYRIGLSAPWRTAHASPQALVSRSAARKQRLDHDFVEQPMPASVDVTLLDNAFPLEATLRLRAPQYSQCSVDQQQDIFEAASTAERLTSASVASLRDLTAGELSRSPRYTTWFGEYDAARASNVISDLTSIAGTLADSDMGFNCNCDEPGVFAYVYPGRPFDVWLCPAFWRANLEGTDSRAGTLVHELSHFRIVAGTHDHVYTQSRARSLAVDNPELAIKNADSFEYFVENTPDIPLRAEDEGGDMASGTDLGPAGSSSTTDRLTQGQARRYPIASGLSVQVESLEGDADLLLYRGNSTDESDLLCSSYQPAATSRTDQCTLDGAAPWTAVVVAHTDVRYRLSVETGGASRPVADDPVAQGNPGDDSGTSGTPGSSGGSGGTSGVGAAGPFGALFVLLLAVARRRRGGKVARPLMLLSLIAGAGCAAPLQPVSGEVDAGGPVEMSLAPASAGGYSVEVTLHNPTANPARVLTWNTPFEPVLSADVFLVEANGRRADYTGRMVKRAVPAPEDAWLTLEPGERLQTDVDLASYYALEGDGPWQVALDAERLKLPALMSASTIDVTGTADPVVLD